MALTCARCGVQNPDGNLYCQACGAPLTAPAAPAANAPLPGPPPGMAPPVLAGPAGYGSPYYTPTGPTVPVHRTPWMVIIAGVVALVVLMAGCGTALAVLGSRGTAGTTGGLGTADVPSPTPAVTPSPVASPPTKQLGSTTESNDGLSVPVPSGWSVSSKDSESIILSDPNGEGEVTLASGGSSPPQTAQDNKSSIDTALKNKYPDTRSCPNTTTTTGTFSGAKGISWTLCFTLTNGVHSVPAAASIFAGANSNGSVYYVVIVLTRQDNLQSYLTMAKPLLSGVHWKLP